MRKTAQIVLALCATAVWAQQPQAPADKKPPEQSTAQADASTQTSASVEQKLVSTEPNTLTSREKIPSGARVYVAPMANGFENYIIAGIQQKKVPVVVVADRSKAEFEVTGVSDTDKAGWAKMLFLGSQQTNESASIKMVNLKTGAVVFAYSVNKTNSVRGKQSAGEACAKHMKAKIID